MSARSTADEFFSLAPKYRTKKALQRLLDDVRAEALDEAKSLFAERATYLGVTVRERIERIK